MDPSPPTMRERLVGLLRNEAPETDFADDDALFGQVIDDYADYARLLDERHGMDDRVADLEAKLNAAAEQIDRYQSQLDAARLFGQGVAPAADVTTADSGDGIPVLPHGCHRADWRSASFFDLARL